MPQHFRFLRSPSNLLVCLSLKARNGLKKFDKNILALENGVLTKISRKYRKIRFVYTESQCFGSYLGSNLLCFMIILIPCIYKKVKTLKAELEDY